MTVIAMSGQHQGISAKRVRVKKVLITGTYGLHPTALYPVGKLLLI